jgi:LacI family transcriptional regulator
VDRVATIKDIARLAGVSTAAVSYVINDKPGVNEENRKKILEIIHQTGYQPSSVARSLQSKKTDIIGLVVPDISSVYMSSFLKYLEYYARKNGLYILIGSTSNKIKNEEAVIEKFLAKNVDGIILFPGNDYKKENYQNVQDVFKYKKTPLVMMNLEGEDFLCVSTNLKEGEYNLTNYLINQGKKNLVFVGGHREHYYSNLRYDGYKTAMSEAGLSPTYFYIGDKYDFEEGYLAVGKYLLNNKMPEAFLAVNDMVALGLVKAIVELGFNVPNDVSVTGFDDIVLEGISDCKVTTMAVPIKEMAEKCIDVLTNNLKENIIIKSQLNGGTTRRRFLL